MKIHAKGKPLKFLLAVLFCWTAGRVAVSQDWAAISEPEDVVSELQEGRRRKVVRPKIVVVRPEIRSATSISRKASATYKYQSIKVAAAKKPAFSLKRLSAQSFAETPPQGAGNNAAHDSSRFSGAPLVPARSARGRWSLGSWLFWRDAGAGNSLASVGQLGGSQAGARLAFQLVPDVPERVALYGRMTTAMKRPRAPEAAIGLSFQPAASVPARIMIERRIALDHDARDAMALMAVGGIGPVGISRGFTVEGYGQAGIVGVHSRDAFADGKLSLQHPLPVPLPVTVGVSLSGGAQPRVARLDIGPQVEARFRIGTQSARVSAEWRQRVAGNARPGSGPAITLAADF